MTKKKPTILDVAQLANVSRTTVSRYLNQNYSKMSLATKLTIEQAIKQLNYQVNQSARALKTNRTHLIGLVMADVTNFYASLVFKGVADLFSSFNYQIIMLNSNEDALQEQKNISQLLQFQVDGLLIQPVTKNTPYYESITIPTVFIDRPLASSHLAQVVTDNYLKSQELAQKVVTFGYYQFIILHQKNSNSARDLRIQAINDVALQNNIKTTIFYTDDDLQHLLKLLIQSPKTAIFVLKGPDVLKTLAFFHAHNFNIPNNIGMATFDDWNWTNFTFPKIEKIQQDPTKIGFIAAKLLHQNITSPRLNSNSHIIVPSVLITGNSLK